jgi:hypothetical protein
MTGQPRFLGARRKEAGEFRETGERFRECLLFTGSNAKRDVYRGVGKTCAGWSG